MRGGSIRRGGVGHSLWALSLSMLSVVLIGSVIAEPGGLIIFSTSGIGEKGNAATTSSSLSARGTTVAFQSVATNLDQADVDGIPDIYVKDLATGELILASTSDTGEKGNDFSLRPSLSADGTRVAFLSGATNLDPTDDHPEFDVYVKDVTTGDIMLASSSDAGERGNFISYYPSLSADGSSVAFASLAWNLDPADPTMDAIDIYVKDVSSGDITLVSTTANGEKSDGTSFDPSLSADGSTVAFYSEATNLDPSDSDTIQDIYLKDVVTGAVVLVSRTGSGEKGNGSSTAPSSSSDGTRVAFVSEATNLDPADTDATRDVYVKDLVTGELTLVSASVDGNHGNGSSFSPRISADGTIVTFTSAATNLHPSDTDAAFDVYVKDLVTGSVFLASASATGEHGNGSSGTPDIAADGSRVSFSSGASNLAPGDGDSVSDGYVKDIAFTQYCRGLVATQSGTTGDDVLIGGPGDDVIVGFGGDDSIDGLGGDDLICGGAGDDSLQGGNGADSMYGESGADDLLGEGGDDVLRGGAGPDTIRGLTGDDDVDSGAGTDAVYSGSGEDIVIGGASADTVFSGSGADVVHGGDGGDILVGGNDDDTMNGENGDDTLVGGFGSDTLRGQGDDDGLRGGPGTDVCNGGAGTDSASPGCETKSGIP